MKYWKDGNRDRKINLLSMMETRILESSTYTQRTFQAFVYGKLSPTTLS